MSKQFVPAADEVWRLQHRKDVECLFFQKFSEEGHYGGRHAPTDTRQGIYCCTPSGRFLASVNTTDPARMRRMLEEALDRWKATAKKDRYLEVDPATQKGAIQRRERQYPEAGLPLRVYTRDMPRTGLPNDWRKNAWNVDSLWYRQHEASAILPARMRKGESTDWPAAIAQRLVRHSLVDNARGQTNGYQAAQVQLAKLTTTVTDIKGAIVTVTFEGESRATTTGAWPKDGKAPPMDRHAGPFHRGVQTRMTGRAQFDTRTNRFTLFELVATGSRWGQTRYNFRHDDLNESPIGFAIVYDENDPGNRVAPAGMGAYGW